MQIPDISKLAWQLNVALIGAIFSAISLIYNGNYIYYGFVTFLFGVISHFFGTWFEFVFVGENDKQRAKRARFYYLQVALILIWIGTLLII